MKIALLLLLLAVGSDALAREFTVGRTQIEILAPAGFVRSTPEMTKLEDLQKGFVPATNEQLAFYFVETDASAALAGNLPSLTRRFSVQVGKSDPNFPVSPEQFTAFKAFVRAQGEEGVLRAKEKFDFSPGSAALSRAFDTDMVIEAGGIVPMAPHEEGERTIAMSSAMAFDVESEGVNHPSVVVVTMTLVLAKDKILNLYAFGGPEDLEWTREKSKEWADAILSANQTVAAPSTSVPAVGGSAPATRILYQGIGGALSAFVVMLFFAGVAALFSARRKR